MRKSHQKRKVPFVNDHHYWPWSRGPAPVPNKSNAAGEPGYFAKSGTCPGDRRRADAQLFGNHGHGQAAGRRPTEHDRDGDNGESRIFRRRYEFVDRVHEPKPRALIVGDPGSEV
jgi:hypothetical protein